MRTDGCLIPLQAELLLDPVSQRGAEFFPAAFFTFFHLGLLLLH